jgi:alpha-N-acetylglucosaminidase
MLHSFGGNRGIYGNMSSITVNPKIARAAAGSLFQGTGLTMEAIDQNPAMYELMNEVAMISGDEDKPISAESWVVSTYAIRRYNLGSSFEKQASAIAAWYQLLNNNYMSDSTAPCTL